MGSAYAGEHPHKPLDRSIASIALPAMVALATDPLYDLCDTAILGHVGTPQLAGAALATRALALGYAIFVFLMFGTTATVARHLGGGDHQSALRAGVSGIWTGALLGCLAAGVLLVWGRSLIGVLGGTGEVAAHAWTYLSISLAGLPAFTIVMVGVGYLRGELNTRTPLLIAAASVALNLVLELLLIFGFNRGVGASAAGTVIAKWCAAITYLGLLRRRVTTTQERWWPDRLALSQLFSVGWPLVARTVALIGTITFAASLATHLGTVEFAAFAVAFSLWQFATYMVDGLEVAGQSLVAHARGRDAANSRLIARRILTWALRLGIGLGIIIVLARPWLAGLITSDPKVITRASSMLVWVALLQPVGAVAFAVDGILVGMARQRAMAAAMIGSALAFVLASHIFPTETAGWAIWASFAVFMTLRTGCGLTDIWFWSHRAPSGMRRRAACPIDTAPCSEATDTPPRASP